MTVTLAKVSLGAASVVAISFTAYGVWTAPGVSPVALSRDVVSRPAPQNVELVKDDPSESSQKYDDAASQPANDASDAADRSSRQRERVSAIRQHPAAHLPAGAPTGRTTSFGPGAIAPRVGRSSEASRGAAASDGAVDEKESLSARDPLAASSADNRAFSAQAIASAPSGHGGGGARTGGAASIMSGGGGGGGAAVSGGAGAGSPSARRGGAEPASNTAVGAQHGYAIAAPTPGAASIAADASVTPTTTGLTAGDVIKPSASGATQPSTTTGRNTTGTLTGGESVASTSDSTSTSNAASGGGTVDSRSSTASSGNGSGPTSSSASGTTTTSGPASGSATSTTAIGTDSGAPILGMPSSVDIGDVSSQSTADLGFDVADSSSTLDLVPSTFTFVDESGGGADETAGSSTSQFIDVVVRPITLSPNLLDAAPTITFDTTLPLSTLSLRAILGPTGGATPAPEPGTLMLVGSGLIAAIRRRRRVRSGLAVLR